MNEEEPCDCFLCQADMSDETAEQISKAWSESPVAEGDFWEWLDGLRRKLAATAVSEEDQREA